MIVADSRNTLNDQEMIYRKRRRRKRKTMYLFEEFASRKVKSETILKVLEWFKKDEKILSAINKGRESSDTSYAGFLAKKGIKVSEEIDKMMVNLKNVIEDLDDEIKVSMTHVKDSPIAFLCGRGDVMDMLTINYDTTSKDLYDWLIRKKYLRSFSETEINGLKYDI